MHKGGSPTVRVEFLLPYSLAFMGSLQESRRGQNPRRGAAALRPTGGQLRPGASSRTSSSAGLPPKTTQGLTSSKGAGMYGSVMSSPSSICARKWVLPPAFCHRSVTVAPLQSSPGTCGRSSPHMPRGMEGARSLAGCPWHTVSQYPRPTSRCRCLSVLASATASGTSPTIHLPATLSLGAGAFWVRRTVISKEDGSGTSKTTQEAQAALAVEDTRQPLIFTLEAQSCWNLAVGAPWAASCFRAITSEMRATPSCSASSTAWRSRCTMITISLNSCTGSSSRRATGFGSSPFATKTASGCNAPAVASQMWSFRLAPDRSPGSTSS
mmetsp:Transcript_78181/g.203759  ORF Transcript_78181/g.203759 Transcript_78181/m.203759 type:complete len:325 (+) Transcript_78181:126-1100(+)